MNFPAVDDVDFLPADYRVRRLRRRALRWRWCAAAAFVGLIVLGLAGNRVQLARLEATRDRLKPQAKAVADLDRRVAEARSEIARLDVRADLRSRLMLRPATTRLLAAVTMPLPTNVALTELHFGERHPSDTAAEPPAAADGPDVVPPERRDLDRLAAEAAVVRHVVTLRGLAPDDAAVSVYLDALRRAGPFDEVRLLFTDRYAIRGNEIRTFSVELRVRTAGTKSPRDASHPPAPVQAIRLFGGAL